MSKGTIIYIGGFELPDKNAAAQRVISNGKLLRELGYKVVFDGIKKEKSDVSMSDDREMFFGFESYSRQYPIDFKAWLSYIIELKRYTKLIKEYPDTKAIICYNLPSGSLWRLLIYCKKKHIKLISDCTEWYLAPREGNFIRRYAKQLDVFLRMKVLHPKLFGIIAISDFLNQFYLRKGVRTIKIPPLVDIKDEKWINLRLDQENNPVEILYAGSPFSISNKSSVKDRLDLIIIALIALKREGYKFRFQVIGVSKIDFVYFFPSLETGICFLAEYVQFHGRVPHEEAITLLKKSDFSIFLRDINIITLAGFPTKFVESISCGVPVLTNRNSNVDDYLVEGLNGFWISMDSIEITLKKALYIRGDQKVLMKDFCYNSKMFDYRKYMSEFNVLFEE